MADVGRICTWRAVNLLSGKYIEIEANQVPHSYREYFLLLSKGGMMRRKSISID